MATPIEKVGVFLSPSKIRCGTRYGRPLPSTAFTVILLTLWSQSLRFVKLVVTFKHCISYARAHTNKQSAYGIYVFCMDLTVNSYYFFYVHTMHIE
jgi:hypothetical protein